MRRVTTIVALAASAALGLSACGGSSSGTTTPSASDSATSPAASAVKVGLAYDIGGRGDKSFNDAAAAGLEKAKTELGVEVKELEASAGEKDAAKEERLRLLADGGYDPVIGVGFAYAGPLKKVAAEFPDTHFAIVDDSSFEAANVANLVFAEQEGSYLVGVIAAQASKAGNVGFIGGVDVPLIHKFEAGFAAGAKSINPAIKVQIKYLTVPPDFTGFSDPAKGKTAAQGMLDGGADVIYAAAGGSGSGAFDAVAAKKGTWAIGVDSDQYQTAAAAVQPVIVTSMLKRVDVAVFNMIKSAADGSPLTGITVFDLKADGVGYSTSNAVVQPFVAKADEAKAAIIAGTVTVPEK